jgi:hypothetical protein
MAGWCAERRASAGTGRDHLLSTLREMHNAVYNLRGGGPGTAQSRLASYLEWVTSTIQRLGSQISAADFDRLVLTRAYERLLAVAGTMTGTDIGTQRVLNGMVGLELTERATRSRQRSRRWMHRSGAGCGPEYSL